LQKSIIFSHLNALGKSFMYSKNASVPGRDPELSHI